jgi:hypothetical protein
VTATVNDRVRVATSQHSRECSAKLREVHEVLQEICVAYKAHGGYRDSCTGRAECRWAGRKPFLDDAAARLAER